MTTLIADCRASRDGAAFASRSEIAGRSWPIQPAAGNAGWASGFQLEPHRPGVPEPVRSPVTAIDSDREAPQRREGRREDERGMVEISGQRSEPVAFRRRQDGPRILPSALIPSLRCSLWGVRAALGYGLDQKANQALETNADSASLRRHRSALRSTKA
jgi:hypothetical protein